LWLCALCAFSRQTVLRCFQWKAGPHWVSFPPRSPRLCAILKRLSRRAESAEQAKGAWRAEESVVQFPLVVAGRPMALPPQKQRLQKSPKRRLTKIRNYGLISYVSQRNSFQGRPADQAGGTGNSPREVCAQSYTSYLSFMSHPCPPANPTPSLKNPAKLPFGSRSNKGQSRSIKVNKGEKIHTQSF
jgi:hypothetical protein